MLKRSGVGQSTIEYVLVLVLVLGTLVIFARSGRLNGAVNKLFTRTSDWLDSVAESLPN